MMILTVSQARVQLHNLLDKTSESHEPIQIIGKRHNAILISEDDWRAVNETIYLLSLPNVRESIRRGLKVDVRECSKKLKWQHQSTRLV